MITVKRKLKLSREAHGRRRVTKPKPKSVEVEPGRIPRISRLMALAIRLDEMLRSGEVTDQTELARLGHVSQPRMTQILNLTLLASDIQEELLHQPRATTGKDPITERDMRPIVAEVDWGMQRGTLAEVYHFATTTAASDSSEACHLQTIHSNAQPVLRSAKRSGDQTDLAKGAWILDIPPLLAATLRRNSEPLASVGR
jgi:hypothetical protein